MHVITCATEHPAVLDVCRRLERDAQVALTVLPVDKNGLVSVDDVRAAITPATLLVSIMHANNEIGTVQPIGVIGRLCRERGILFHTDATQTVGRISIDVDALCIDLLSMSAHKCYGPKGCGALYVRDGIRLVPLLDGGGQESGVRSGTLNVAGIVGLGQACALAQATMADESAHIAALRSRLQEAIVRRVPNVCVTNDTPFRLPGNLHVTVPGVPSRAVVAALADVVAVSAGSACSSSKTHVVSHVLTAIGFDDARARTAIRFGLGRFNTEREVELVAQHFADAVALAERAAK